jgi:ubiquinone/menaquinone biosynthesis C-methylase UbiE
MTQNSHISNLEKHVLDLKSRRILDLGSGLGKFVIAATLEGYDVVGFEKFQSYIDRTHQRAQELDLKLEIYQGNAENLPFGDKSFGFVNMSEVIEHVDKPRKVLKEVERILKDGGGVYMSVPNRFGLKDQHFHLYFLNWMPRSWAHVLIGALGKHKNYSGDAGVQRIDQMHYYTLKSIKKLVSECGLKARDIREEKIKGKTKNPIVRLFCVFLYNIAKHIYLNSFHLLLEK